jgi:hypothetical protein
MSGCPIIGFISDATGHHRYGVVAIQSGWLRDSRITYACRFGELVAVAYRAVGPHATTQGRACLQTENASTDAPNLSSLSDNPLYDLQTDPCQTTRCDQGSVRAFNPVGLFAGILTILRRHYEFAFGQPPDPQHATCSRPRPRRPSRLRGRPVLGRRAAASGGGQAVADSRPQAFATGGKKRVELHWRGDEALCQGPPT